MKSNNTNYLEVDGYSYILPKSLISNKPDIESRLANYKTNVFVMIKYRDENLILRDEIKACIESEGFNCIFADDSDWDITGSVNNPIAVLNCCKYGIAVFDKPEKNQNFNPNVAYELGIMHSQQKDCLILINKDISDLKPFDIIDRLHKDYKSDLEVKNLIGKWLTPIKKFELGINGIVVAAIVKRLHKGKNQYLVTQRKRAENDFCWGFPAGRVRNEIEEHVFKTIEKECIQETGVEIKPMQRIGARIHPITKTKIIYLFCKYISGKAKVGDDKELNAVSWKTAEEIKKLFSDIFDPVRNLLEEEKQ